MKSWLYWIFHDFWSLVYWSLCHTLDSERCGIETAADYDDDEDNDDDDYDDDDDDYDNKDVKDNLYKDDHDKEDQDKLKK